MPLKNPGGFVGFFMFSPYVVGGNDPISLILKPPTGLPIDLANIFTQEVF